ncbi:MAG TPA: ATP-binding cassette domain-containing protein [Mobilitalea sp.]|nr:ATP-binding cassette domain-containing protein [Mobilitalea sp.]
MSLTLDITKQYKSFTLKMQLDTQGKATGLLGASGCGKSLTLKCIAGIETPDSGRIILNGKILYDSERKINLPPRERNIGYMFQNYALFPNMTVGENIEIAVRDKRNKKLVSEKMLAMFRLTGLRSRYPHQLSGGEQQRVALARMLAYEPEVLMFDEPFSALDSFLKDQLGQELAEVLSTYQGEIMMVSHSRDELYRFCENIAIINKGKLVEFGEKTEVFANPIHVITAKLTGCKNISRARKISDYEIEALDWGMKLKTLRLVDEEIWYVGIRAHNMKPAHDLQKPNSLKVTLAGFSEGPFENSIIFRHCEPMTEEGKLWWIVPKQKWKESFQEQVPSHILFPEEHLLLLKDTGQAEDLVIS